MRATRGALRARLALSAASARHSHTAAQRALPAAALRYVARPARLLTHLHGSAAGESPVSAAADGDDDADELAADLLVSSSAAANAQPDCRLVLGVDPDVHGALGVMRWGPQPPPAGGGNGVPGASGSRSDAADALHSEVFSTPAMEVMFGSGSKARSRLRHDPQRIDALLRSLRAPPGTLAVLERPHARARDGSSAAFYSGCGLGLWWGLLTAQGFTVRLALPRTWKQHYSLVGREVDKNDSRAVAAAMFPEQAAQLARKLDHGRAEALLIAAYGCASRDSVAHVQPRLTRMLASVLDGDSAAGVAASAGAGGVVPSFAAAMKQRHAAAIAAVASGSAEVLAAAAEALSSAKRAARAEAAARAKAAKAAAPKQPRRTKAAAAVAATPASPPRSVAELREALRALGLKVSGTKAELELRLAASAVAAKH